MSSPGYPILLNLTDRLVVIIGGGTVAARKARGVLRGGAERVRMVAPVFCDAIPDGVERVSEPYRVEHLHGASIVFAATDRPEVNATVVRDARRNNMLVHRADADDADPGDFTTPARWNDGALTVSVSAGSAALAGRIRDELRVSLDPRWARLADAMRTLRPAIRKSIPDPSRRREALCALATPEALERFDQAGVDRLRSWLSERYPELRGI